MFRILVVEIKVQVEWRDAWKLLQNSLSLVLNRFL